MFLLHFEISSHFVPFITIIWLSKVQLLLAKGRKEVIKSDCGVNCNQSHVLALSFYIYPSLFSPLNLVSPGLPQLNSFFD